MIHYITKQINPRITLALITLFFTTQIFASDSFKIDNTFSVINDSNILRQAEKLSDTAFVYTPKIKITGTSGNHSIALNYSGNFNKYKRNDFLDYNEHIVNFINKLDVTSKLSSYISFRYEDAVEEPGITDAATNTLNVYNQFNKKTGLVRLTYGKRQSIGQITLGIQHDEYNYTNNAQEFRDYRSTRLTSAFYYRLAPKTRLLLQANFTDFNYDDRIINNSLILNQSNNLNVFLTGVEWAPTAKFQGVFTIGYQSQRYEDDNFNNINSLSFLLDTTWKPNTYTEVQFSAERETEESAQINSSSFITNKYDLDVIHKISKKTNLIAKYSIQNNDIVSINERTDIRSTIELGLKHELLTWLEFNLNFKRRERTSDISSFEFDSNITEISISIQLD